MSLIFVDVETTGTDPLLGHEVWEAAAVDEDGETVFDLLVPVMRLELADPQALAVGRFHERHPQGYLNGGWGRADPEEHLIQCAGTIARALHGKTIVNIAVHFDELFLRCLVRDAGLVPDWPHQLVELRSLMAGWTNGKYTTSDEAEREALAHPWHSKDLARCVGVEPTNYDLHTALGDAQLARDIYMEVMA